MDQYEALLKSGMSKIRKVAETERLEVPQATVIKTGQRTVISNFIEIAAVLRREPQHMLKYLAKVLATFGEVKGKTVEFIGNFTQEVVNKRIDDYMKIFVTCQECKKLDTKIIKEGKFHFMKCEACGARQPIERV